jgi:hypothetical protein
MDLFFLDPIAITADQQRERGDTATRGQLHATSSDLDYYARSIVTNSRELR